MYVCMYVFGQYVQPEIFPFCAEQPCALTRLTLPSPPRPTTAVVQVAGPALGGMLAASYGPKLAFLIVQTTRTHLHAHICRRNMHICTFAQIHTYLHTRLFMHRREIKSNFFEQ